MAAAAQCVAVFVSERQSLCSGRAMSVSALRSLDRSPAVQAAEKEPPLVVPDGIPELLPARAPTIEEVWVIAHFAHLGSSIPGAHAMLTVCLSRG